MLTLGWAALVWQWQDPFTAAYTSYQQHKLKSKYHKVFVAYKPRQRRMDDGPSLAVPRSRSSPSPASSRCWFRWRSPKASASNWC